MMEHINWLLSPEGGLVYLVAIMATVLFLITKHYYRHLLQLLVNMSNYKLKPKDYILFGLFMWAVKMFELSAGFTSTSNWSGGFPIFELGVFLLLAYDEWQHPWEKKLPRVIFPSILGKPDRWLQSHLRRLKKWITEKQ